MQEPLNQLAMQLILILVITITLSAIIIILQVNFITKSIKRASLFAMNLANGDFTIEEIRIKGKNELAQLGDALNKMLRNNKEIITKITTGSNKISQNSDSLNETATTLSNEFHTIETAMSEINEAMMNASATTEEINASVEEVNSSVSILTNETAESYALVNRIHHSAVSTKELSEKSFQQASNLVIENESNLKKSLDDAKIVEAISQMAERISEIAEQVNLLSLNASIEAARAGEHGRGFAVVAKEIGTLAAQTSNTVEDIKHTISQVVTAFDNLSNHSTNLLTFLKDTVTPDYKAFVDTASEYKVNAEDIQNTFDKISEMTVNIENIIKEVAKAISEIAEGSQDTSVNSSTILHNANNLSNVVVELKKMTGNEKETASDLNSLVKRFQI